MKDQFLDAFLENLIHKPDVEQRAVLANVAIPTMSFISQHQVRIPVNVSPTGDVIYCPLWAVNFICDARRSEGGERRDVFTMWVAQDGTVAKVIASRSEIGVAE